MTISTHTPFHLSYPDALAVYCSDGRFTESVEELLQTLGYDRLDTLTLPGGPGLLDVTAGSREMVDTVRKSVTFLVSGHSLREVVLLAHEGCGYYKKEFPYESHDAMMRRQISDLRQAMQWVVAQHSPISVHAFYARVAEEKVHFDLVESIEP